jgi:sugar transferase (PEP-CTERM system associated)
LSKVNPGYLNKNGNALMLFEGILLTFLIVLLYEVSIYLVYNVGMLSIFKYNPLYVAAYFVIIAQVLSLALGLYSKNLRETFRGICQRMLVSFFVATFSTFLLLSVPADNMLSMLPIITAAMISLSVLCYLRYQLLNLVVSHAIKKRILILGSGKRAFAIEARTRREVDRRQFNIHAYVGFPGDEPNMIKRDQVIELDVPLERYVLEHNIEQVVVACDERRNNLPFEHLTKCKNKGVSVVDVLTFIENETGQIAIDLVYPDWLIYSAKFVRNSRLNSCCQWLFNSIIAIAISFFVIPAILITAVAIKIEDGLGAPVFYRQTRIGSGGKLFDIVKLRSMSVNAEKDGAVWAMENDSRVTRVGQIIRKYRIDELPQLFNVLKGDMGFVGPRPERPEFVEELSLSIPFYNERHHVKPGLTGWAQIKYPYGASQKDALEKLTFDFYYIKNRSYLFDLFILLRTAETVLFSRSTR